MVDGWKGFFAAVSADPGFFCCLDDELFWALGMDTFGVHEMSATNLCFGIARTTRFFGILRTNGMIFR